jgi:glutamate synthase domain-containing protein 2
MAMGCDMIAVAREAMLSIGCIQAQKCHTGHCPTGVATNKPWLVRGLDPTLKAARFANYVKTLRKEMLELSHAVGVGHPALLRLEHFEILNDRLGRKNALDLFGYSPTWTRTNAKSLRDAGLIH